MKQRAVQCAISAAAGVTQPVLTAARNRPPMLTGRRPVPVRQQQ